MEKHNQNEEESKSSKLIDELNQEAQDEQVTTKDIKNDDLILENPKDYQENIKLDDNIELDKKNVLDNLDKNEPIKEKTNKRKNFSFSEVIILVVMSIIFGTFISAIFIKERKVELDGESIKIDKYLSEFINNYQYIVNNYYEDIDRNKLIDNAITGMMEGLDYHSTYMDEDDSRNFQITSDGSYKGLGIQMAKDEETGYMLITSVFNDSPAEKSGIQIADRIISIDNVETKDKTASEVSDIVRNNNKDEFSIKILRNNEEIELTINQAVVTLASVASKTYDADNKKVGYIYISTFAKNTGTQFKTELDKLEKENISYLIIDVRNNTGGHLTSLEEILNIFLTSKQVMYQFEHKGDITKAYGTSSENKPYKIILLANEASASASEVLIAGLKENLNSIVIGKKTYGKGTSQNLIQLSDGTNYKITTKKWLTPNGNWINDTEGIEPDIEIDLSDKYFETFEDADDTQLEKALEYIKNN